MKKPVSTLKSNDLFEVRIPNSIARNIAFRKLPPLAIKVFFYILAKRQQDGVGHTVCFHLQDLFHHSHPYSSHAAMGGDYTNLHIALHDLRYTYVETFGMDDSWRTRSVFNIIGGWKLREDGIVQVTLGQELLKILDDAECKAGEFTLLVFNDGMKPKDARPLRMLLLAYHLQYLLEPWRRTFSIPFLKRVFGLSGPAYSSWKRASTKIKSYANAVSQSTHIHICYAPPKRGIKIDELVFDVENESPQLRHKPTSTKRKEKEDATILR